MPCRCTCATERSLRFIKRSCRKIFHGAAMPWLLLQSVEFAAFAGYATPGALIAAAMRYGCCCYWLLLMPVR